jgi:hypothetical protein
MCTNTKVSTPVIKKFDGDHLWAFKTKCYLIAKSLCEYVDPGPNTGNTTMTSENVDSLRKAHVALILHLEDNPLIHVISLEWAWEVWLALLVIHHSPDMSSKQNVTEMFNRFNYESTNMKEHLTKFQHIVQFPAAECTVSECDLGCKIVIKSSKRL